MARKLALALIPAALTLVFAAAPATAQDCAGADTAVTASNIGASEVALQCLVNAYRAQNGRAQLGVDGALAQAARAHSNDMVAQNYFEHTGLNGSTPRTRATAAGYQGSALTENIVVDTDATPRLLFEIWRKSPGHNQNMLDPEKTSEGLGIAFGAATFDSSKGATATHMFGNTTGTPLSTPTTSKACTSASKLYTLRKKQVKNARKANEDAKSSDAKKRAKSRLKKRLGQRTRAKASRTKHCG